jgi:hypothetical protein
MTVDTPAKDRDLVLTRLIDVPREKLSGHGPSPSFFHYSLRSDRGPAKPDISEKGLLPPDQAQARIVRCFSRTRASMYRPQASSAAFAAIRDRHARLYTAATPGILPETCEDAIGVSAATCSRNNGA